MQELAGGGGVDGILQQRPMVIQLALANETEWWRRTVTRSVCRHVIIRLGCDIQNNIFLISAYGMNENGCLQYT